MSTPKNKLQQWLEYSTTRIFLSAEPEKRNVLALSAALNERFSFQVAFRLDKSIAAAKITPQVTVPDGWQARVRRVGHVPVRHMNTGFDDKCTSLDIEQGGAIPGYVPDVLFDNVTSVIPNGETHSFWITVIPGENAKPGKETIKISIQAEELQGGNIIEKTTPLKVNVSLANIKLSPRHDFNITHWFYADSLIEWYHLKPFEPRFWEITEQYMRDYGEHGLDTIYVPSFTPPLDGVKRPTQLIKVTKTGKSKWSLDWSDVDKWIKLAKKCGITHFEWVHPFTQWGVKYAIRIYEGQGEDKKLLWPTETPACSALYKKFLTQYYSELHAFLRKHGILTKSFFHISDEPHANEHMANYAAARNMIKEIAPWVKTMDALTDIEFGRNKVTDMPVPSISTAVNFQDEGIDCWCYYCCGPRGAFLNRLLDTPLPKIAMHGFLFYRWPFKGFLHWGYNYWFRSQTTELIDVFEAQDGFAWPGWAYGDTLQVYPGKDGSPLDSIRWEVFSESLQDYQLLQTLGIERNDKLLKDIRNFADFPKTPEWRRSVKEKLLKPFMVK